MTVLAATDFSPSALEASRLALEWGRRLQQPVTLVHVVEPSSGPCGEPLGPEAVRHLRRISETLSSLGMTTPTVLVGSRGDEIERLARSSQARLLVLGAHGRLDAPETCHHAVLQHLLRSPPCPLLLVPHEGPHPSWHEAPAARLRVAAEVEPSTAPAVLAWLRGLRAQVPCDLTLVQRTCPGADAHAPLVLTPDLPGEGECTLRLRPGPHGGLDPLVWEGFVASAQLLVLGLPRGAACAERAVTALRQSTAPLLCLPC